MSQRFLNTYKVFQKIKWSGMIISGCIIFLMMMYICVDVLLRNVAGTSFLYAYEFSQNYLMPLAVLPGLAFAFGLGMMPRIEFIIVKLKEKYQRVVAIFLIVVEIIIFLLLTIFGWQYAMAAFADGIAFTAGGTNFPKGPVILFVPISFFLVTVEMIFLLVKNIKESKPSFTVLGKN